MAQGRRVVVEVVLDRLGLLLVTAIVGVLALGAAAHAAPEEASAPAPLTRAAVAPGRYYLTAGAATGTNADTACASGYHMASLWEILDVSNLAYDTTLGYQHPSGDQGDGPPTGVDGWVRTGGAPSIGGTPGGGNCAAWSSSFSGYTGTVASLPTNWSNPDNIVGVWEAGVANCSSSQYVWCVQPPHYVYLPLVLRNF